VRKTFAPVAPLIACLKLQCSEVHVFLMCVMLRLRSCDCPEVKKGSRGRVHRWMSRFVALLLLPLSAFTCTEPSISAAPLNFIRLNSENLQKSIGMFQLLGLFFRAVSLVRKDGDVGVAPPPPSLPSQPSAPCAPSNELYYMFCGERVLCSEAVFNLCSVNGGEGSLCVF